jgi:hypothetical protein
MDRTLFWTTADRKQAGRFQGLFQPSSSRAYRTLGPTTRGRTATADREAPIVPMGISLPRTCIKHRELLDFPATLPDSVLGSATLVPRLDASSPRTPVNRVSATAIKSASSINSRATGPLTADFELWRQNQDAQSPSSRPPISLSHRHLPGHPHVRRRSFDSLHAIQHSLRCATGVASRIAVGHTKETHYAITEHKVSLAAIHELYREGATEDRAD